MMNQPNTPREAFEALDGKRPDLLLTETKGAILVGYTDGSKVLGDYPSMVTLWAAPGKTPLVLRHSTN